LRISDFGLLFNPQYAIRNLQLTMELLVEAGITKAVLLEALMKAGHEILAISVASNIAARKHK